MTAHRTAILLLLALTVPFGTAVGQDAAYRAHASSVGARIAAMGGASVSDAFDATSVSSNPATASFLRWNTVSVTTVFDGHGRTFDHAVALPSMTFLNVHTLSFGVSGSLYGDPWSRPILSDQGLDAAYAVRLYQTLSAGAMVNVRVAATTDASLLSASGSVGFLYAPTPGISYGLAMDGLGRGADFDPSRGGTPLRYDRDRQQRLRIGATFRYPSVYRAPYLIISMESQKLMGLSRTVYRAGISGMVYRGLWMRYGLIAGSPSTAGTVGAGYAAGRFAVDYASSVNETFARHHQVTVSYALGP